jgi:hypothetical protein
MERRKSFLPESGGGTCVGFRPNMQKAAGFILLKINPAAFTIRKDFAKVAPRRV